MRFRSQPLASAPDIVKSLEWFGSGGAASRAILISARVVDAIEKNQWRGVKWDEIEFAD